MPDQQELTGVSFEEPASPADTPVETPEPYSNAFFNSEHWINTVPEQDRPIVQKYAKDVFSKWDAGVNQALEDRAKKIKEYETLGKLEELQQATGFFNAFRTNGQATLAAIIKKIIETEDQGPGVLQAILTQAGYQMSNEEPQEQEWDYSQGEPDPTQVELGNIKSELEEFRQWKASQEEHIREQKAIEELDNILGQMHTARPDIPQQFLVQGIAAGNDPANIVALYDQITKGNSNSQSAPRRNPPVVMGGQGGVPSGQVDVSKLTKEQRQAYVAQMLEASES